MNVHQPIARKVFHSIMDASNIIGVKPHVLRYWETQFAEIRPMKNRAGNRIYKTPEIEMILFVRHLLYEKKHSIGEARKILSKLRGSPERAERIRSQVLPGVFAVMLTDLTALRDVLTPPDDSNRK